MRTTLWDDFKLYVLHSGNVLNKLLAINIAVFVLLGLIWVIQMLFQLPFDLQGEIVHYLSLPQIFPMFIIRFWTFITYQFVHAGFFHILMNMVVLLFAGRIFREYLGDKKLLATYLLGGIAGGIMCILAMNLFPLFSNDIRPLVGASASVMAILAAIGTLLPNYTVYMMFLGPVRLIYIVLALAVLDLLSLAGSNAGGHWAHIGGLIWGFAYIRSLKNGYDLGAWLTNTIDAIQNKLKPKPAVKVRYYNDRGVKPQRKKNITQDDIDAILDKIAKSGYDSLSQQEKDILFRASKES